MAIKSSERATLIVAGQKFEDWSSIWVQHTYGDAYSQFRFTCAERDGASGGSVQQASQQFKPGDDCTVLLAGQLAIEGEILTRQVAYDAYQHGVMLHGVNKTWSAATSSIEHKTGKFDDKDFKAIADEVLEKTGVKSETEGSLDKTKWKYMQCAPGEPIFHFLERIARDRKIIVTCTKEGKFLFVGEGRQGGSQGQLEEGRNILKCQCVISNQMQYSKFFIRGQINGTDKLKYQEASEQEKTQDGKYKKYRVNITNIEQGVEKEEEVEKRAKNEAMWSEAQEITATITVQGWQPGGPEGGGSLWEAGKDVKIKSPMAMIDQTMSIQSVTFSQDNHNGSLSTLVCVAPWGLNGSEKFRVKPGTPTTPQNGQKG